MSAFDDSPEREQRIRERAYRLWDEAGRPHGQDAEFWERARELDAIAANPGAGQMPVEVHERVDEAAIQENLGEFPTPYTDQGDRPQAPLPSRAEATKL